MIDIGGGVNALRSAGDLTAAAIKGKALAVLAGLITSARHVALTAMMGVHLGVDALSRAESLCGRTFLGDVRFADVARILVTGVIAAGIGTCIEVTRIVNGVTRIIDGISRVIGNVDVELARIAGKSSVDEKMLGHTDPVAHDDAAAGDAGLACATIIIGATFSAVRYCACCREEHPKYQGHPPGSGETEDRIGRHDTPGRIAADSLPKATTP